jgi:hypothetical protein
VNYAYAKAALDPFELQMLESQVARRRKSVVIAFVIWFLIGTFFIHRVYLNKGKAALVAEIVACSLGLIGAAIMAMSWSLWMVGGTALLIVLLGVVLGLIGAIMTFILFIVWLLDVLSIWGWVEDYNEAVENRLIDELVAARGTNQNPSGGGAVRAPLPPTPSPVLSGLAADFAAASNALSHAWDGMQKGSQPLAATAVTSGHMSYVESGRSATLIVNAGEEVLIGRDPSARVRLSDNKVSRKHALLQWRGTNWLVRDLGATNATRLLGQGGEQRQLRGETHLASGQLLVGDAVITLFPSGE